MSYFVLLVCCFVVVLVLFLGGVFWLVGWLVGVCLFVS